VVEATGNPFVYTHIAFHSIFKRSIWTKPGLFGTEATEDSLRVGFYDGAFGCQPRKKN
jgi:hypothetical protein